MNEKEINEMLRYIEQEILSWDYLLDRHMWERMIKLYSEIVEYRLYNRIPSGAKKWKNWDDTNDQDTRNSIWETQSKTIPRNKGA